MNDIEKDKEDLEVLEGLCLLDDFFMTVVFDQNIGTTEFVLNIILGRDDLEVIEVVAQREYKNPVPGGRSIRLDIYAKDSDGKVYDIEVQNENAGADVHRARFHSSMLDTKMLKSSQEFKEIHDSYVIFITRNDYMNLGFPMYHVERNVQESGELFGDGSHILYVNGAWRDDSPVGKLMHDFSCTDPDSMNYALLADRVRYFKKDKEGVQTMSKIFEDFGKEVAKEAAKGTLLENIRAIMKNLNYTVDQAMDALSVPNEDRPDIRNMIAMP